MREAAGKPMAAVVGRVRVPQPCSPDAAELYLRCHRCDTFDRFTYEDAVSHPAWCEGAKAINIPGEAGPGPQQEPGGAQGPGTLRNKSDLCVSNAASPLISVDFENAGVISVVLWFSRMRV